MPLKFKSLPDAASYLNVPESEIMALAAGGVLPVHFRHYGRAGLFALVGSDCLTTVPSSDFIEAGIYRSMFNPMLLREAPMEVYLPTTAILPVDPPRSVPVGQIMARVDEISRELDNSDIESSRWLFLVADLDAVAKTLAPTAPEHQVGAVPTADSAPAVSASAESSPPTEKIQNVPDLGVSKDEILATFDPPIPNQTKEQWANMLGDARAKWLKSARVHPGGKGIQSRWNPALLAVCLSERKLMQRKALGTIIRRNFPEYLPEWEDSTSRYD